MMPIYRRDYEITPWQKTAPDNKWYKEYVFADDIWKVPVDVPVESVKAWREAYYMWQRTQQQSEFVGEI